MPKSTEPLWDQGSANWRHDETGGWQAPPSALDRGYLPAVVLPTPSDFMTEGKPIEVYAPQVLERGASEWLLSLDPRQARYLGCRLIEAAAITEMQSNGAM